MLAGVDYVLMGAGIPRRCPRAADRLRRRRAPAASPSTSPSQTRTHTRRRSTRATSSAPTCRRCAARRSWRSSRCTSWRGYLARDAEIRPDGFVVEGPVAGGHSAPAARQDARSTRRASRSTRPRTRPTSPRWSPLGLPFWLAGALRHAREGRRGACGRRRGRPGAARSSRWRPTRASPGRCADAAARRAARRHADGAQRPAGLPDRLPVQGGAARPARCPSRSVYEARPRICDLGYLREPVRAARRLDRLPLRRPSRCTCTSRRAATPPTPSGRKCLCNALIANIGLPQLRKDGYVEQPAITLGQDLDGAQDLLRRSPTAGRRPGRRLAARARLTDSGRRAGHRRPAPRGVPATARRRARRRRPRGAPTASSAHPRRRARPPGRAADPVSSSGLATAASRASRRRCRAAGRRPAGRAGRCPCGPVRRMSSATATACSLMASWASSRPTPCADGRHQHLRGGQERQVALQLGLDHGRERAELAQHGEEGLEQPVEGVEGVRAARPGGRPSTTRRPRSTGRRPARRPSTRSRAAITARPLTRSQERVFILCGIADEPTWPSLKPSVTSSAPAISRIDVATLDGAAADLGQRGHHVEVERARVDLARSR